LPASASGSGWLSLVEELAVRVMLGLVGMVLLLAGFYVAGQRSGLAPSSVGRRLSSLSS
jgi:spore maturation protein SpmA